MTATYSCIDPDRFFGIDGYVGNTLLISTAARAAGLLPFARAGQCAVEEFGGGAVGADPIAPAEQLMNFVGED